MAKFSLQTCQGGSEYEIELRLEDKNGIMRLVAYNKKTGVILPSGNILTLITEPDGKLSISRCAGVDQAVFAHDAKYGPYIKVTP